MRAFYILSIFIVSSITLFAQNEKSSVTGLITDDIGPLPGARISFQEIDIESTTNLEGEFQINNITPDSYTLIIDYIGYETLKMPVDLSKKKILNLGEIKLNESSIELSEILIKGNNTPSQARALNIKKSSLGIMEVLASDAIGKLPDRNAAEAVQRIQGVSIERDHGEGRYVIVRGTPLAWNSTLLNGNRMPSSEGTSNDAGGRTSPLDIFPSEMIQYVQLSKALTPDIEGDAIGGSVNFITKTAPNKRTLNVNVGYGYNDQASEPIQSASVLYGDKTKDGKFGFLVSGSYWNRNWGTDNFEVEYEEDDFAIEKLELRDYLGKRTTYGLNVGLEYNINNENKIYARGMYTDFQDDESAVEHIFSFADSEFTLRQRRGIIGLTLKGGEIGGDLRLNNRINLNVKLAQYETDMETRELPNSSRSENPVYQMAMFTQAMSYDGLASNGKKYLDIDAIAGYNGDHFDNIQPNLSSPISTENLGLEMLYGFQIASYEKDQNVQFDFDYDYNESLKIETGYKYKRKYLERGSPSYIDVNIPAYGLGVDLYVTDLESMSFPSNGGYLTEIDDPYNALLQNPISYDALDTLFGDEFQQNTFYEITNDVNNPSSAPGFYTGYETTNSAYLMGVYDINSDLKAIAGFRYEHVNIEYDGHSVITEDVAGDEVQTILEVNNSNDFSSFLPMVHLKYTPQNNLNLRLAYTRSYARANFADLNPTESTNLIFNTISRGNINLKPTYSNNFDFMAEYFYDNVGYLSAGLFYKDISNVIYSTRAISMVEGERFDVYQPRNSENGYLYGLELGFSRRLGKDAGVFKGFGLECNYTYADSEMDVPSYALDNNNQVVVSKTKEKLPNQSSHIFNAGIFYENAKISAKLAGNYKGKSLAVIQGNPENYRWYDKNFTVDFSASYNINNKMKVYFELNNLTNEPLRYYQGNSDRPEQTEYYSLRGLIGFNYKIF